MGGRVWGDGCWGEGGGWKKISVDISETRSWSTCQSNLAAFNHHSERTHLFGDIPQKVVDSCD